MRHILLVGAVLTAGCASNVPQPGPVEYLPIPEGYLQECKVPPLPKDNGKLSEAFLEAAQCAMQGNEDKAAIRGL